MLNILIATSPDDSHAIYTKLALEKKGCNPVIWYTADFPIQQTHSFKIINHDVVWNAKGSNFQINNDKFDVVWYRRPKKPTISKSIDELDIKNSEKENAMLYQTFWENIAHHALWINPVKNARAANSKLLQLKIASKCGLEIPPTLISNNPTDIKLFLNKFGDNNVIYKPLFPLHWIRDREMRLTYTSKIKLADLPEDDVLQSTPGIFQKAIEKSYELRVTYFGSRAVAIKINSQIHKKGIMDWRYVPIDELPIEEYTLPAHVDTKCQALMKDLGLVFGCFDFIVTPDHQYIFLEINEAGQFLWVEDLDPNIKMLDIFTDFIIHRGNQFDKPKNVNVVSINDFRDEARSQIELALKTHQNTHHLN